MRIALAILAVLAFVGVNNPAEENNRPSLTQQNRQNENPPAPAPTCVNNYNAAPNQQSTDAKPPQWYYSPEWWLCILGIPTLIVVGYQTKATANAASAAMLNAKALINAERAWILVKRILPPKDLLPPSPQSDAALEDEVMDVLTNDPNYVNADAAIRARMITTKRGEIRLKKSALLAFWILMIGFKFKVYGNTPAKITEFALVFRVVNGRVNGSKTEPDLIEPPEYGTPSKSGEVPDMGSILAPKFTFTAGIPLQNGKLSPDEVADIIERKKFMCAYGFVRYRDSFEGTPIRETRFCYVYDVRSGGVYIDPETSSHISPDAFRVGGPDSYNQAT